ncbi:MAG: hypothetical protein ABMB14_07505 [Myxococcota bacterium]
MDTAPPSNVATYLQAAAGIGLVVVANALVGAALAAGVGLAGGTSYADWFAMLGIGWMMGLGLAQLVYVVPMFAVAWFVRRPLALGIGLGALLILMLQTTCYGLVFAAGVLG